MNRINQFVEPTGPPLIATGAEAATLQKQESARWVAFLERQIQHRPQIFLGVAFTLGLGLAWLIKRK